MEENNFKKEYLDWRTHLVKHSDIEALEDLHFFFRKEKKELIANEMKELFDDEIEIQKRWELYREEYKKLDKKDLFDSYKSSSFSEDFDFGGGNFVSHEDDLPFFDEVPEMDFKDPDADLIIDLANEKSSAYHELYECEFSKIRESVLSNSGSLEDAFDVFQEGLVVLLEKIREPQFKFTCRVGTYLYSCCMNIWRNQIRRKKLQENIDFFDLYDEENVQIALEDSEHTDERLKRVLDQLSESCLKLIKAFYYELKPWSEIAVELNYTSEGSAKNQKYKCLKNLIK